MRYVVAYTDRTSGKNVFKGFDYHNDALEFIEIEKKKGLCLPVLFVRSDWKE